MNYQKLFDHMSKAHGVTLLESEMNDIIHIVEEQTKAKELRDLVKQVRAKQKEYFRTRQATVLIESKELERKLDQML